MSNNVFFVNGTNKTVYVMVNNAGDTHTLAPSTAPTAGSTTVTCNVFACPTSVTVQADHFATGEGLDSQNDIGVQIDGLQDWQHWQVTVKDVEDQDLCIYLFKDTIVGEDSESRTEHFTISMKKQHDGDKPASPAPTAAVENSSS